MEGTFGCGKGLGFWGFLRDWFGEGEGLELFHGFLSILINCRMLCGVLWTWFNWGCCLRGWIRVLFCFLFCVFFVARTARTYGPQKKECFAHRKGEERGIVGFFGLFIFRTLISATMALKLSMFFGGIQIGKRRRNRVLGWIRWICRVDRSWWI